MKSPGTPPALVFQLTRDARRGGNSNVRILLWLTAPIIMQGSSYVLAFSSVQLMSDPK